MSISRAIGLISGINECVNFFQWTASSISSLRSRFSATQEKNIQDEVSHLQRSLQRLRDTLPAMYGLIDRAEWRSHKNSVAELLPILKDAVYDADDILDEFGWHELNVAGQGNTTHSAFADFYKTTIQGSANKVNDIQERLDDISSRFSHISGLHEVAPGFDKSVRPDTISSTSKEMFGRDRDLKQVMGLLGVPQNNKGGRQKRKRASSTLNESTSNQVSNESRAQAIPVLPIVGMGGIGKTTLAQHICNHRQVKSYFDLVIWICADDFDVKRLTNDAIQSSSGKQANVDHLDSLQRALSENLSNKRFLIVVDDVWDDALKENGQRWEKFCAPFRNVVHGSMMLVTTRSPEVADGVCTMEPFLLHGLTDAVFWDLFKLCAFGSKTSNNSPDLELIGRSILPKLKGSPLAAITLGRILRMKLDTSHWKNILESELWELKQNETDILPALRLSYMYLPFHLKRCFSFCAVYPKDHKFEKDRLAAIWAAEGFVEPQGDTPLIDIASQYFQDLFNRSFFQKVAGSYVIHDLLHDMAQLVSVHDCFIIKSVGDFDNVPQNVRHLYVLPNKDFDISHLLSLCKHTKLRTILCKFYVKKDSVDFVIDRWFGELKRMRVLLCASINKLPDSVGNLKHLRYLEITRTCPLSSIPSEFCCLHNLQRVYAEKCNINSFPSDFNKLIRLQRFESIGIQYPMSELELDAAHGRGPGIRVIKIMNQLCELRIHNLGAISKEEAAEAKLKNKKCLHTLHLDWSSSRTPIPNHSGTEVFEVLQPATSLKHLLISGYPGVSLPSWFQPQNFPRLATLSFENCDRLKNSARTFSRVSQNINVNETIESNDAIVGTLSSLRDLTISGCGNIVSLHDFLDPASVSTIRKIKIDRCASLVSVATGSACLEELEVVDCPNICSQRFVEPYLRSLKVFNSGNLAHNIDCCSVTCFQFSSDCDTITLSVPALEELRILDCTYLRSIRTGGIGAFPSLVSITVNGCIKLPTLDGFLTADLPAVEKITISGCPELSLPGERFGSFHSLKKFEVRWCYRLNWQRGLVLPSSLQELSFNDCGDISIVFPSCLHNLAFLVSLNIQDCRSIRSIPGNVWQSNLLSLKRLTITSCPNLESIGGKEAIAKIQYVKVASCGKMKDMFRILRS
ncbi:hypothetical protein QYE76_000489 [Lolium multiflorum]|uniref:Disease resistance protein n=1 Tax=Lolium multiflorum TaxID=4521 RepID=A0AAD8RJC8_LOLMU|nr:hypothetical protein QYE76_000489 [Lolium multiflorum]